MTSGEHRFALRVYYEDTDASGVAYHANYLRWFERARTEWLRALGTGQESLRLDLGIAFTVANLEIDFRRPARLDDVLEVVTRIDRLRAASIEFEQTLGRSADGLQLAQAWVRVGCVDAETFRPAPMPEGLIEAMSRWTGTNERANG